MSRLRTQKANEETFKPGVMVVLPQQLGLAQQLLNPKSIGRPFPAWASFQSQNLKT